MYECPGESYVGGFRTTYNPIYMKQIDLKCKDRTGEVKGYDMDLNSYNEFIPMVVIYLILVLCSSNNSKILRIN